MDPTFENYELYLDNIAGVMVIDMEGTVTYMNEQCAQYLKVKKNELVGKNVLEVFPHSKMIEGLSYNERRVVFYSSYAGIGISIQKPLFVGNKKVGLLEYDAIQGSEFLYDFADKYRLFLDQEFKYLPREMLLLSGTKYSINNIIGSSQKIINVREQITQAARSNSTVLITGETGTGKELVAHSIHNLSNRRKNPFVRINASALPEALAESELFGYEEGSFTGAIKEGKKGKFEQANTGTLFIDEINHMPLKLQPKLLRALQEKEIDRIGGAKSIPVDVRIIAASSRDLKELIKQDEFRQDLYYRLNVIEIHTPSLRERMDDITQLTESIILDLNLVMGKRIAKVSPTVYRMFEEYDWPGNVRELHNVIERAMNFAEGDSLLPEHFEFKQVIFEKLYQQSEHESNQRTESELLEEENPIETVKNNAERELLIKVLSDCGQNKSKAAEVLKIARPLLYQKMKRLQIEK
ncbi:MAG: sigma 54-interacting transcriptional regulator [Eubacteriales bacterium]|nr:sigma 54-interacting transcriptional regulator [Eubacteriales bacterium]MDD3350046.1 sigma 54-interacting transcriptional regulator [Eubacteriales bacterium]